MIHYSQLLREKVVELLKAADIAGINDRVFSSQFVALRAESMPCIVVYSDGEKLQKVAGNYDRLLSIVVEIFVAAGDSAEDQCDSYRAEIEAKLDLLLGGMVLNGGLVDVRKERNGEGNQQYMTAELTYGFRYLTSFDNPTTATN